MSNFGDHFRPPLKSNIIYVRSLIVFYYRRKVDYNGEVDIKTGKTNGGGVKIQKKMEEQYNNDGRRSIHLKNYDIDPHGRKEVNRVQS